MTLEPRTIPAISKSKYLNGLQCLKLVWTEYNDAESIPPRDEETRTIFDMAHRVGDLAKRPFPNGREVSMSKSLVETAESTRNLLPLRVPIFEASFLDEETYCRADILVPVGSDEWHLIEVKSSTRVKDVNLHDVAFQDYCLTRAGLRVSRHFVMHINRDYVRRGDVDPQGLLRREDVTDRIAKLRPDVRGHIDRIRAAIEGDRPEIAVGARCSHPYECPLKAGCWAFLPDRNITEFQSVRVTRLESWLEQGYRAMEHVPEEELNARHLIQRRVVRTGRMHADPDEIRKWLGALRYPLHCLDFETVNPAIPHYEGTRPYQQVPFQFSVHTLPGPGEAARHAEFLADSADDPRVELLRALREAIGDTGTVLAFNAAFEKTVLNDLGKALPEWRPFTDDLVARMEDLAEPFRKYWIHHPDQRGSCSLKSVLPALTGTGYEGLEIRDGGQAVREFTRVVLEGADEEERARVLQSLREYCGLDTSAMIRILERIEAMPGVAGSR